MDQHNVSQWVGNVVSVSAIITSALGWAPALAALVAMVWYAVQIYESETVRRWRAGRTIRKLARMKARVIMLEAQYRGLLALPKSFDED
jgi:hypothetical protein